MAEKPENIPDSEISRLVETFYEAVRADNLLAPVFDAHVKDWPQHLRTMKDFWSSVANTSGRYKGHPMMVHMQLQELEAGHFERWLNLFRSVARETLNGQQSDLVISRAERIAESFKLGLGFYRNIPLQEGQ